MTRTLDVPISRYTVYRCIQGRKLKQNCRMCRKSTLKLHKTILRVFCIKKHMHWKDGWLFFFKTPKEFNLKGLDEWAYCLHDVRWKYYLISSLDVNKVWLVS